MECEHVMRKCCDNDGVWLGGVAFSTVSEMNTVRIGTGRTSAGYIVKCAILRDAYRDSGGLIPGMVKKGQVIIDVLKGI